MFKITIAQIKHSFLNIIIDCIHYHWPVQIVIQTFTLTYLSQALEHSQKEDLKVKLNVFYVHRDEYFDEFARDLTGSALKLTMSTNASN